nr:serine dehydratase beta chain [Marinobacter sediminum]
MFISVLDLFRIGVGQSSSHTVGPMGAAHDFVDRIIERNGFGAIKAYSAASLALRGVW